jgi:hypothetical protein
MQLSGRHWQKVRSFRYFAIYYVFKASKTSFSVIFVNCFFTILCHLFGIAWNAFLIVLLCFESIKVISILIGASLSFMCFSALYLLPITSNLCKAKLAG